MLSLDQMPEENEDLAKIRVEFQFLPENPPVGCPASMREILEYLSCEGEDVEPEDLEFLRTAKVADDNYWIWRFVGSDGAECYATVSLDARGAQTIGYDENYYHLTPEQFMLGDYHDVF